MYFMIILYTAYGKFFVFFQLHKNCCTFVFFDMIFVTKKWGTKKLKDLVRIDFEPLLKIMCNAYFWFLLVYEYKDNKKIEKVRGIKPEFVIADGEESDFCFNVEFQS